MKNTIKSNSIMYSSYLMHHSTTNKVEKTENSINNKLFESNNYFRIIDNFYNSLGKHKNKYKNKHNNSLNFYVNLIIDIVENYNKTYLKLKNLKDNNASIIENMLYLEIKKYKFNLNQIGIKITPKRLLNINLYILKNKLKESYSYIDFLFEKYGLLNNLMNLYPNSRKKQNFTHINKKV